MDEHVHAMYYQTILLVMRPVLLQPNIPLDLLTRCAKDAADACENAQSLNLSPQSAPSLVGLYQTFLCGITLLQCLAIQATVLSSRQTLRAVIACSSTLAVYTRLYAAAAPFRELFAYLSDAFLGGEEDEGPNLHNGRLLHLRSVLEEILIADPSEIPG
jgi:hypothetical protein